MSAKIINETGSELVAGTYWAIGEPLASYTTTKPVPALVKFTGEAPCLNFGYFGGPDDCSCDTLRIIEPVHTPDKVLARLEERIVAHGQGRQK